jgi:hypothetical protein
MPMTKGLQNMRSQTDQAFPNRDRTSDGGIGDEPHRLRTSGHNPDDTPGSKPSWNGDPDTLPEWRAWDMDADLRAPGVTTQQYVDHVRRLPGLASVVRYIIFAGKIYHERAGFAPAKYDGDDQHNEHVHIEGAWSQAADNNATFDFRLGELTMPDAAEIRQIIREELAAAKTPAANEVRRVARTSAEFLSDTEKNELVNRTVAGVVEHLPATPPAE